MIFQPRPLWPGLVIEEEKIVDIEENNKNITILGAGSSGMATAAYLTLCGFRVTLCDTEDQAADFAAIRTQGGIELQGGSGKTGCAMPWKLTTDFAEALEDSSRILVCVSASRHEELARRCMPLSREGQVFLLSPGNFGSFVFRRKLSALGKNGVVVAELCGNLWACRRRAPGQVLIAMPLKQGVVSALPSGDTGKAIAAFEGILPLKAGKNVLEVSLNSPNIVSHVAGAVLNAAQVERMGEAFAFFQDGLSEAVIHSFVALEQERNAVMEHLGLSVYGASSEGLMRKLMDYDGNEALSFFRALEGPSSFSHRYISEDAACGVSMLVSLGQTYQIPVTLTQAFLTVAGCINNTDYMKTGHTLNSLGLSGLMPEELLNQL